MDPVLARSLFALAAGAALVLLGLLLDPPFALLARLLED